jgi:hypothetical protein
MARPKSIRLFELFYLGSVLVEAVNTAMTWAATDANPQTIQVKQMLGPWFPALLTVFTFTLWLLLWYFAARTRSNIARWVIAILYVLGLIGFVFSLTVSGPQLALPLGLSVVSLILTTLAVICLFRRDASAWFGASA